MPTASLGDDPGEVAASYLHAARATTGMDQAQAAADGSVEVTTPVGDLDGDSKRDVLSLHAIPRTDYDPDLSLRYTRGFVFTLRGRLGTTGATAWTYSERAAALGAVPIDLGAEDGVLVFSYEINYTNGVAVYPHVFTMRLTTLGADGLVVWQDVLGGPMVHVNFVGRGGAALPLFRGTLDAVAGDADDLLVDTVEFFRSGGQEQHPVRIQATVLDGSTGRPASTTFRTVRNADYYLEPFAIPAPDLDADGLDDVLFVIQRSVDAPASLAAVGGADGAELWSTEAVQFGGAISILPAGDATGDGTSDLAVTTFAAAGEPSVFLVSGRNGAVQWSRPGGYGYVLGDPDADDRADVGVFTWGYDGETIWLLVEAVDPAGALLHAETHALPEIGGATAVTGRVDLVGDVHPDGAADLLLHLGATFDDGRPSRSLDVLISGATGKRERFVQGELPLSAAVTPSGDDLLRRSFPATGGVDVTIVEGLSGAPAWRTLVADGLAVTDAVVAPADLTGDGAQDLLVNAMGAFGTKLIVLDATGGEPLWQI